MPQATDPAVSSSPFAVTWAGHATVLVEIDGVRVLTDPVLRDRIGPLVRIAPTVEPDRVGRVDCVLLSHLHADHTDIPTLRAVARSGPILAPYPARDWLIRAGLRDVRELRAGEEMQVSGLRVLATAARHGRSRRPFGPAADPIGYVIRGSRSVYFAGDTDLFPEMTDLRGSIDVALLPVWGWGPRPGSDHLNPESAGAATALIAPGVVIPIHWGTFALDPLARWPADHGRPAREFALLAKRYAPGVEIRVLAPGERAVL